MEDNKKKTTTKTKKTTKTTDKVKKEEVKVEAQAQPQVDMNQMFQMFQSFMAQMQQPQEQPKEETTKTRKRTENVKKNKSYLRKDRKDDEVTVRSIAGVVSFKSPKSNTVYNWYEVGDEEILTIEEVLQMEAKSKKFLHAPWLYVEDDEVNEILGIKVNSDNLETLINIDKILEDYTIGEIEELLEKATDDYKKTFSSMILNKIKSEELRDGVLIREIGRILDVDFELFK